MMMGINGNIYSKRLRPILMYPRYLNCYPTFRRLLQDWKKTDRDIYFMYILDDDYK